MWISQDLSSEGGNKFMMMSSQSVIKQQQQQENNNNNKSNFSQTCNLLSQYLKEKGSFGDLSLGIMARNPSARTENNLTSPITEMPAVTVSGRNHSPPSSFSARDVKSMDLFPQNTGFGPFQATSMETIQKKASDFSLPKPKVPETAQMTIFYAGKVIVFDDLPADKAKEVMLLASQSSPQNFTGSLYASTPANEREILKNFTTSIAKNELPPRPDHHQSIASDLPIARKASLHRFLEKRKDRISSKAPYQITNNSSSVPAANTGKPPIKTESKSWLGLASQSSQ